MARRGHRGRRRGRRGQGLEEPRAGRQIAGSHAADRLYPGRVERPGSAAAARQRRRQQQLARNHVSHRVGIAAKPRPYDGRAGRHPPHQYPVLQPQDLPAPGPGARRAAGAISSAWRASCARPASRRWRKAAKRGRWRPCSKRWCWPNRDPRITAPCLSTKKAEAYADPRLRHALQRLRSLKQWMGTPLREQGWPEMARQVGDGEAAMYDHGRLGQGRAERLGPRHGRGLRLRRRARHRRATTCTASIPWPCSPPTTRHQGAQEKMAQVVASLPVQLDYNQVKGSMPALRDADLSRLDSCARASWRRHSRAAPRSRRPASCTAWPPTKPARTPSSPKCTAISSTRRSAPAEAQRRIGACCRR